MAKQSAKPKATNTVHFACFNCRVAFKQPGSSNWKSEIPQRPFRCPNCKCQMLRLGKYFKAPPQHNTRQWYKVELLCHYGERFVSSNLRLGIHCKTLTDAIGYLSNASRPESEVRTVLKSIRARRSQKP